MAGIKGKITAFNFTDEELAEFIQDEVDEDRYIKELEEEWRKNQLSRQEREDIFAESMSAEEIFELKRIGKERVYEEITRKYFETKQRGEDTKTLEKERFHRKLDYEIFTYRPKDDKTISQYQIEQARKYPLEKLIESKKFFALCPFHNEKTPSMYIKKNFYYCFGCGEKGDAISFVMKIKKYNFQEAVKYLQ